MDENDSTPKKTVKRRRVKRKPEVTTTGYEVQKQYCRKCCEEKATANFYPATNTFLDANGVMSICKDCCNGIFNDILASYPSNYYRAFLNTCRMLDVVFLQGAIDATLVHLERHYFSKNRDCNAIFGIYKSKISSLDRMNSQSDLRFVEPPKPLSGTYDGDDAEELAQFWGSGFEAEDYIYLETELDDWKKTHKSDTKAEVTLLKELCHISLAIKKQRLQEGSVVGLVKEMQTLMKTANVDPAKASIASAGKSQDTFSSFIKTIEETEPAEFYEDKTLFKDYDNIGGYFDKYVTRPIKNFITGSRDFNVDDEEEE